MMIDFDAVYQELIAPAINMADLEPLRADEEKVGGIIHKSLFERLILCEYAIADSNNGKCKCLLRTRNPACCPPMEHGTAVF